VASLEGEREIDHYDEKGKRTKCEVTAAEYYAAIPLKVDYEGREGRSKDSIGVTVRLQ